MSECQIQNRTEILHLLVSVGFNIRKANVGRELMRMLEPDTRHILEGLT